MTFRFSARVARQSNFPTVGFSIYKDNTTTKITTSNFNYTFWKTACRLCLVRLSCFIKVLLLLLLLLMVRSSLVEYAAMRTVFVSRDVSSSRGTFFCIYFILSTELFTLFNYI